MMALDVVKMQQETCYVADHNQSCSFEIMFHQHDKGSAKDKKKGNCFKLRCFPDTILQFTKG